MLAVILPRSLEVSLMKLFLLFSLSIAFAWAQPTVAAIQNNYGYVLPGLPNYGIAQGSIFVLYGSNLSSTSTPLQGAPLKTALDGVTVTFTVAGQARTALLYYVTPTQIAGILPSSTPVGTGTIVVSNNGRVSGTAPLTVVQSAFGILTINSSGRGPAAVFDAQNNFLAVNNATHAGDVIVIYGSGAGPSQGEESVAPTQTNLAAVPILVEIGGRPAQVLYHGRTLFPGLDQINVVVPAGITPGCSATLTVTSGQYVSNFTTIPVAASGPTCPIEGGDPALTISAAESDRWIAAGQYTAGSVGLTRSLSYVISDSPTGGAPTQSLTRSDSLGAGFNRISGNVAALFNTTILAPTPGSCMVTTGLVSPITGLIYKGLDAGPAITSAGPAGSRTAPIAANSVGVIGYSATVGDGVPGNYLDPGTYTLSGTGGPDIGAFSDTITVPPDLVWTNRTTLETIDRTTPITLTWTGGEPTTLVTLQGTSTLIQGSSVLSTSFECWARNSDGRFTIPASVLLSLLPSGKLVISPTISLNQRGSLSIASVGKGTRIRPAGLDYGTLGSQIGISQSTLWK